MTIGNVTVTYQTYAPSPAAKPAVSAETLPEGKETPQNAAKPPELQIDREKLKQLEANEAGSNKGAAQKAEAFAYGALGMNHPEDVRERTDDFYTAGQILSALGTVGTVLLAVA